MFKDLVKDHLFFKASTKKKGNKKLKKNNYFWKLASQLVWGVLIFLENYVYRLVSRSCFLIFGKKSKFLISLIMCKVWLL